MIIKILGAGCSSCTQLEKNTKEVLKQLGLDAQVVKVSDIQDILSYSIMSFPALVIDEKIVIKDIMTLSLTSDHRAIDGAIAGQFLQKLSFYIQSKETLSEISKF